MLKTIAKKSSETTRESSTDLNMNRTNDDRLANHERPLTIASIQILETLESLEECSRILKSHEGSLRILKQSVGKCF